MTSKLPNNVILVPFRKAATADAPISGEKLFEPFANLAYQLSGATKSGGIFRIGPKGLHYPENGDISMSMTYYKPFQGQDPTWERTPFFRLSRSGDLCKTISAVLMINQNGELKKQVVERHHEEDFVAEACFQLKQWAKTVIQPHQLTSINLTARSGIIPDFVKK